MTVAWPSDVNQNYILGSYTEQPDTNTVPFNPEVGPPKIRRRASISVDTVSFDQLCTRAEWASLLDWYRNTIKESLPFTRKRPRTCSTETFMFVQAPEAHELARNAYQVSIRLKSMP